MEKNNVKIYVICIYMKWNELQYVLFIQNIIFLLCSALYTYYTYTKATKIDNY